MSRSYGRYFSVRSKSSAMAAQRAGDFAVPESERVPGDELRQMTHAQKLRLFQELLDQRVHGLSFSAYVDGQAPGTELEAAQISARLEIIQPHVHWIRSFSCIEGNQEIARLAHERGLKTMVGVELTEDREANELELANGIEVAKAGHADILVIGNEVVLRADLPQEELLEYIRRAKLAVPGVPVSYVDAYFLFEDHPVLAQACDVLLVNCYPFWEGCPVEFGVYYMAEMYRRAKKVAAGKKVIISETGWPTAGSAVGFAVPGLENALEYFVSTFRWAQEEGVEVFYFSSFDESWKVGEEGDVGAFWGLWDKDGALKHS